VSSREGLVQAASNLGRLRSESFQSDDGEDTADDAEHAPRGPQDKPQSALSLLTAAASPAVSGPPVSPRSQPPVDLAVLLAPELGVQVRPSDGDAIRVLLHESASFDDAFFCFCRGAPLRLSSTSKRSTTPSSTPVLARTCSTPQ